MKPVRDDFARFEHEGWERVADKYNLVWSSLLARQSPENLEATRIAVEEGVSRYTRGIEFVLPIAAHVVVVSKV